MDRVDLDTFELMANEAITRVDDTDDHDRLENLADLARDVAIELRAAYGALEEVRPFIEMNHHSARVDENYWQALTRARRGLRAFDEELQRGEGDG